MLYGYWKEEDILRLDNSGRGRDNDDVLWYSEQLHFALRSAHMQRIGLYTQGGGVHVHAVFGGGHAGIRRIIEPLSGHTRKKVHARRRGDAERSLLLLFLCG